jgi:hypothetical protein
MTEDERRMRPRRHDIARLVQVAKKCGCVLEPIDAMKAWEAHSADRGYAWLDTTPYGDGELFYRFQEFLELGPEEEGVEENPWD